MRFPLTKTNGFSLIEVTLALGVASIGLTTIIGLLSVATETGRHATQVSAAVNLFAAVAADLRTGAGTSRAGEFAMSQRFAIPIPPAPTNSATVSTVFFDEIERHSWSLTIQSRFRMTIMFLPNTAPQTATLAHLRLTWPAQAAPADTTNSVDMLLALARN